MAVAVAILEIFSVKEWPDLEISVWSPSLLTINRQSLCDEDDVPALRLPLLRTVFLHFTLSFARRDA